MLVPMLVASLLAGAQAGAQATPPPQPPVSPVSAPREQAWPPPGVSRKGPGVTEPKLVKDVKPVYTAEAMRNKISGSVQLEAVVETDGTVSDVRVMRSFDREFGMDDQAVAALKQWKFTPGTKDGVPARVIAEVHMTFTLR